MKTISKLHQIFSAMLIAVLSIFAIAPVQAQELVKVTADNYVRAESDIQMKGYAVAMDAFGKFAVNRTHYDVDNQVTVRGNRDTMYMFGTFDQTREIGTCQCR